MEKRGNGEVSERDRKKTDGQTPKDEEINMEGVQGNIQILAVNLFS